MLGVTVTASDTVVVVVVMVRATQIVVVMMVLWASDDMVMVGTMDRVMFLKRGRQLNRPTPRLVALTQRSSTLRYFQIFWRSQVTVMTVARTLHAARGGTCIVSMNRRIFPLLLPNPLG